MSVKSFMAAAREAYQPTPSDEVELFYMFNVDITPYGKDDLLPSCELNIGGDTFYCNVGQGKAFLPLWIFKPLNPQKVGKLLTDKVNHAHDNEDFALPFLQEYPPGSRARLEQLERFYRDNEEQSAFNIPDTISLGTVQHFVTKLLHKHAEF